MNSEISRTEKFFYSGLGTGIAVGTLLTLWIVYGGI